MEIIQTYMSEELEICVISDGVAIHFADKNDLTIESAKVGSLVKPSQMSEVYLEVPISVLQEVSRRSEIYVEPDAEEDEDGEEEDEEEDCESEEDEEEEDGELEDWRQIAKERFLQEHTELEAGIDIRVLSSFNLKVSWLEGEGAYWNSADGSTDLYELLQNNEALQSTMAAINERIIELKENMDEFASVQRDLGHDIESDDVEEYIAQIITERNTAISNAAE
ncbi:MAG: hypothetical protein E4H01_15145 [Lysobacterales bacterium]|nr:MAG: hypothetical protein E4H01_15145 [Xanthomonadales bacterium]